MSGEASMSGLIDHVTYDRIVAGVDSMIPFAEGLAKITETKWDDGALAVVKTIRGNELLMKWIHDLVCGHPEIVTKTGAARDEAMGAALEATAPAGGPIRDLLTKLGLTWEQVTTYLPTVLRLLFTVLGLRG